MKDSKIEWTDHTFNPWWGCARIAPECKNCHAATFAKRTGNTGLWDAGDRQFRTFGDKHWNQPLKWNAEAEAAGVRRRVFCASMADVFDENPALAPMRARLARLILDTPHLDWLLLTKRPAYLGSLWPWDNRDPDNVWLGTSVGHLDSAHRLARLTENAAYYSPLFVSAEPLLMDISGRQGLGDLNQLINIDWVIVGGESGPGARPFDLTWARRLRDLCLTRDVKVFIKQLGARPMVDGVPLRLKDRKGGDWSEWPEDLRVRQVLEVAP